MMIMQAISDARRSLAAGLLGALILMLVPPPVRGAEIAPHRPHAANVDWVMEGGDMVISYDLVGDADAVYVVEVVLRRAGDPGFRILPARVSGDVGEGKFAGPRRSVRWHIQEELGGLPEGGDFLVEVTVDEPDELPWFLVVVGVAVGGATVYSFVQNGEAAPAPPILELPGPPARP